MLIIIVSVFVSLSVLLSAFVSFFPNLRAVIKGDYQRRAYANEYLYSLQYGQLAIRAGTLTENRAVTFPPRVDCPGAVSSCQVPAPVSGVYLSRENGSDTTDMYSTITYAKISGSDPSPVLQIVPVIRTQ